MKDKNLEVLANKLDGGVEERNQAASEIIKNYGSSTDPEALFLLGKIYEEGYGVTIDYPQAFYYYREGSKQNDGKCQLALCNLYVYGKGCKKNYVKAVYYAEKAAENKVGNAEEHLHAITEVIFNIEKYELGWEDLEWLDKKGDSTAQKMKETYPSKK